jgi:large subunit ribosomal protein L24
MSGGRKTSSKSNGGPDARRGYSMKIRRDDTVTVISGKDRGKTGKVLKVDPKKERVYVEGLNIVKRHQKPSALNPNAQAGVIEREAPIHISNVALVDPKDNKPTRLGIKREDGKRFRVARRSGTQID